jgi:D-arginine dehydrogenase
VVGRPEALSPMLAGSACGWAVHLPGDGVADAPKLVRRLLGDLLVRPVPSLEVDAEVVATGAWAAPEAGLVAFRRHLVRAHPRSAAVGPWVWVDDAGVYLRPGRDGLLASSCDEEAAPAEPPRGTADEAAVECVQRAVERWFPAVGRLDVRDARFGLRTFAPDRRPVAGPDPDIPGRWRLLGLGGSGVSTSMALGIDLAARIAEQGAR